MSTIDPWLNSDETGDPFTHCIHCRMPLLELDSPWLVNKDFHRGECTLEYAICQSCRDQVSEQLSEESKTAVREFLEEEIPWEDRIEAFIQNPDPATRFRSCIVCENRRELCDSYATSILLDSRGEIEIGPLPLLICSDCTEQMAARLSTASRDTWEDFLDNHFEGPPQASRLPGLL